MGKAGRKDYTERSWGSKCAINSNQFLLHERKMPGSVQDENKVELFNKTRKKHSNINLILHQKNWLEPITFYFTIEKYNLKIIKGNR